MLTRLARNQDASGEHWLRRQRTSLDASDRSVPFHLYGGLFPLENPARLLISTKETKNQSFYFEFSEFLCTDHWCGNPISVGAFIPSEWVFMLLLLMPSDLAAIGGGS